MVNSDKNIAIELLRVIDKLEVGPVRVEPDRLVTTYKIYQKDSIKEAELIYKYQEPVFNQDDAVDQNLANMITAQVAINYGLFCQEICFNGYFDQQDRRLISDMIENTAREIYVKKILEYNPFLVGKIIDLPLQKLKKYNSAIISFSTDKDSQLSWQLWENRDDSFAILSSGGKDSLLSYGLLNEIGREVHPIFINESGRHWFTAMNAYKYFSKNIPNTSRVWTNADRVFNWMLRHFSFIRQDFKNIRSDEYPIRLWTVAVFIFGALPILRKRKIGRLIIGDEHDTTNRSSYQGITHYDGLYDQSRFFDNMLSRYFLAKGWAIAQFSIIRPLSELLILKILTERYPDLQKHQVSCHAAHISEGRVYPCGKCEKCRRIIGMLSALGADPRRCGYKKQQIRISLDSLEKKGIHQESEGQQQLMFMLKAKALVKSEKSFKERPEILHLRFDSERSPIDSIPNDLRKPLYNIYLKHAQGALRRIAKKWHLFNLLSDHDLSKPYPFDTLSGIPSSGKGKSRTRDYYLWAEMTWPEAEEYLKIVDVALLPVGSIEQHGPHLPLDTDSFDAQYLARQVATTCSDPKPLVLPLIPYGVSYHHDDFKGTISINNDTLSNLVYEIGMSAAHNGIKKLVIINGHSGNSSSLNFAAQMINRDARIFVSVDSGETSDVDIYRMVETPNDVHAGEFETSTALATRPHLVKMDLARSSVPEFSSRYLNFTSKRSVSWYAHTERISRSGIMGDPTKASKEKGKKMWQIMVAHLVSFVEDLKRMSLDEIHQLKY